MAQLGFVLSYPFATKPGGLPRLCLLRIAFFWGFFFWEVLTLGAAPGFTLRHNTLAHAKTSLANVLVINQSGHSRGGDGV